MINKPQMAWFSKFKFLLSLKLNWSRVQFRKELKKLKILKSQNKVWVSDQIGFKNDIDLNKIGGAQKNEWGLGYQKPCSWVGGWMDVWMGGWK